MIGGAIASNRKGRGSTLKRARRLLKRIEGRTTGQSRS
jgi:hypothetical protein